MKSPMVENADYVADKASYSELKVLCSGAGYYVGTMYLNKEDPDPKYHFEEPGSRDSDYFASREKAENHVALIQQGNVTTRMQP
jgi:hypothetical protein